MASLIEVLRRVNGKPEKTLILVEYKSDFPDGQRILTIGTEIRKCRKTGVQRPTSLETYVLEEYPDYDGHKKPEVPGRSFHLTKQSDKTCYAVFISETGDFQLDSVKHLCHCTGFLHHGCCKHISTAEYLVASGLIADPKRAALVTCSDADLGF